MSAATAKPGALIGWDIGGAHTKMARLDRRGRLIEVAQYPCPLWRGPEQLDTLLSGLNERVPLRDCRHAVTMTGELADIFKSRRDGVRRLLAAFGRHVQPGTATVYALDGGLHTPGWARRRPDRVASANWHATASWVARHREEALLVDIGSTTTDLVAIRRGKPRVSGYADADRLRAGELLYTGLIRTPVMAVVKAVPFGGEWQDVAAEHFATLADVYHLTGDLAVRHDQAETADGRGRTPADCARRLARMVGRDLADSDMAGWRRLAGFIAGRHQDRIREGLERLLSRTPGQAVPLVGAGVGRAIVRRLARRLDLDYVDFSELAAAPARFRHMAAVCAPAVAVARLAHRSS